MDDGRPDDNTGFAAPTGEYQRKNCRVGTTETGNCTAAATGTGSAQPGVDPNRNYGALWGGAGTSTVFTDQTYRGPGPFSEPETRNIRDLVSKRQVTTLITNHTYGDLLLRPPGVAAQGPPPDEAQLKALGDSMAAENGYSSQKGYELYDTTGSTEDWSYLATGGFGYTFEIGCDTIATDGSGDCAVGNFHPQYAKTIAEYEGTTARAGAGEGNREAYMKALESTGNTARHSVIRGSALPGTVLRVQKSFKTKTSPVIDALGTEGPVQEFEDRLESVLDVPASGSFEWHVNPSTRPAVIESRGRDATGPPSAPVTFDGDATSAPPCPPPNMDPDPACWDEFPIEAGADPSKDDDGVNIRIDWATPASDWDLYVVADADGSGSYTPGDPVVGSSAVGNTNWEQVKLTDLTPGEKFIALVVNYAAVEPYDGAATFLGPEPFVPGQVESWTMTCETPGGTVLGTQPITVKRGESVEASPCPAAGGGATPAPAAPGPTGGASPLKFSIGLAGKRGLSNGGRGTRSLFLRSGRSTKVTFDNPNDFAIAVDYRWSARTLRARASRTTVLHRKFTIPARSKRTLRLRLTRKGARALRRAGRLTVRQSVVVTGAGQRVVRRGTLTLRVRRNR